MRLRIYAGIACLFVFGLWSAVPLVSAIAADPDASAVLAASFTLGALLASSLGSPLAGSLASSASVPAVVAGLFLAHIMFFYAALRSPGELTMGCYGAAKSFSGLVVFFYLNRRIAALDADKRGQTRLTSMLMLGSQSTSFMAAPVAGIAVTTAVSASAELVIVATMLGAAALLTLFLVRIGPSVGATAALRPRRSARDWLAGEFVEPARVALRVPWFRVLLVGDSIRALLASPLLSIMAAVVAARSDSLGSSFAAVSMSAAAGGIAMNLVLERFPRLLPSGLRGMATAATFHCLSLAAVGLNASVWIVCVFCVLGNAGWAGYYVGYLRTIQDRVRESQIGKWLAVDTILSTMTAPVGLALVNPAIGALGLEQCYLVGSVLWILVLVWQLDRFRTHSLPEQVRA